MTDRLYRLLTSRDPAVRMQGIELAESMGLVEPTRTYCRTPCRLIDLGEHDVWLLDVPNWLIYTRTGPSGRKWWTFRRVGVRDDCSSAWSAFKCARTARGYYQRTPPFQVIP